MNVNYIAVLTALYPGKAWVMGGDDYEGLAWYEDTPQPSRAELDAAWPAVRDALAWDAVRAERDRLLAASDWTQVADSPLSPSELSAWQDYRQELRDVPQSFANPDAVVWPVAP